MGRMAMVFLAVFLCVTGSSLDAALLANEGFDYGVGSLDGQNDLADGFRWAWSTGSYNVEAGSLDMHNLPFATRGGKMAGSGSARRTLGFQGLGLDKANLVDLSTDDTVYMSVMLARSPGNWVELRLMDGTYTTDLVKFGLGSNNKFTVRMNGASAYGGIVASSDACFVVLKIVARASGDDEIFVKGYSASDAIDLHEPDSWTAVNRADMDDVIAKLDFTATAGAVAKIDELRVGSTWADVVPDENRQSLFRHPSFRHVFKTTYQYRIYDDSGAASPRCLAVDGAASYADGSPVKLEDEEDRRVLDQHWYAYPLPNGKFHLRTIGDSFYMRADPGTDGLDAGDPIRIHSLAEGGDREWDAVALADGKLAFHMGDAGLCMAATSFADNTPLEVAAWQDAPLQRWTLKNQEPLLSPFILKDSNGELLVFFRDILRSADNNRGFLYASADGGQTWTERTVFEQSIYEPTLFVLDGALYMLYMDSDNSTKLQLKKSTDHGHSWSNHVLAEYPYPIETGGGADVLVLDGFLFWGFFDAGGSGPWPEMFRLRAASCPVDSDLADSGNWTITDPLSFPSSPALPGTRNGWLEPNCVEGPDGRVWLVARVDKTPAGDAAAILKVSADRTTLEFTNQYPALGTETGFIHAPWAGSSTFHIVRDNVSERYLVMSNPYLGDPSASARSPAARNILALYETADLKNYQLVKTLVDDDSYEDWAQSVWHTGFQSPGFVIDGSSLKYVCRTAYRGFGDYHDGNMITYHELENFRDRLSPDGEMAWYRFDSPEEPGRDSSKMGGNFAEVFGAAYTSSGKYGGCLLFDGIDDSLGLMHRVTPKLEGADVVTLSAWFKCDAASGERLFSSAIDALHAGLEVSVSSTEIRMGGRSEPDDAYQSRGFAFAPDGQWRHLVAQWDFGNDTMRLWLDKIEQAGTGSVDFGSPQYRRGAPSAQDRIGSTFYRSGYFSGCIDEFHIYGRALDEGEVAALYNGPGYGEWSTTYSLAGGADDDDDQDGLANLGEYGLGGDPTNPADQGVSPEYNVFEEGGTNWFGYVHPIRSDPDSGLLYYLEQTDDLVASPWTNSANIVVTGTNVVAGALSFVSNRISMAGIARQFVRLVIEQR